MKPARVAPYPSGQQVFPRAGPEILFTYQKLESKTLEIYLCYYPAYGIKAQRSADFSPAFLSTTLSALDEALHGGGASGSLTEITGPPGCGKTQFCIMMSILATLSTNMEGLKGAVVYIDTESAFSAERLVEIAESRFLSDFNTEEKLLLTSCKVHLYRELTCDEVLQKIESLEEEIISKGIKLVTIDSLASVVNKEFDTQLPGNLNKFLAREASSLKYLAEEFSIPAVQEVWCQHLLNFCGGFRGAFT
ncbi:DNA repair protein RAD51 homolog 2-like [Saimiri boliviensis]|uniref:DNA repair protein RAD51 homolog 2-like n=1 Tax=Saimiri boliviensis TaxID=27679 RepID=UPI003D789B70